MSRLSYRAPVEAVDLIGCGMATAQTWTDAFGVVVVVRFGRCAVYARAEPGETGSRAVLRVAYCAGACGVVVLPGHLFAKA